MILISKKRFTFEDFLALFFGIALWLIYLYPVWKTGAFSHPVDWLTMVHGEGISLSTGGKWFFEYPHRFLTDGFSGDFPIFYNYFSYYLLSLLAKLTGIPPMVLEAVYVGPFWGFLYVVVNYIFLSKTFHNKKIALLGSVLMAFMWHSRITDFYFTEYGNGLLHVGFVTLMLSVTGLILIFFVPALCLMYLAYTRQSIQYKIYHGLLLGIILQTHTLTFINILFINFCYLGLNNLFQFWKSLTADGRVKFAFIIGSLLTLLTTVLAFRYANGSQFLLPPFSFVVATPILFACLFFLDKNKSFYLISYPISLAISIPYLLAIKDLSISDGNASPTCIACTYLPIHQLIIFYYPHFLAALVGIWFLVAGKFKNQELLIWVFSLILATFILSYNNFVGWGNHPYRFAIHLLMPLMIAAAVGLYYGYIKGGIWKVASIFLAIWFTSTIVLNVNDVFQNRRIWDNPSSGTQEQYDFLKQVEKNTISGDDILLTGPEFSYATGVVQTAMLLNFSKERAFIPDYRYILQRDRYSNRLKLFCFLFPSYPHYDLHTGLKACEHEDGAIHLENGTTLEIKDNQIKNSILPVYGIKHLASLGEPFTTFIKQQADSFKWKILASNSAGTLAQPAPVTLTGVAIFEKGQYHAEGFTANFEVAKAGSYILVAAGNNFDKNVGEVRIDGKPQKVSYQDNSVVLLKIPLAIGKHELFLNSTLSNNQYDYMYFVNFIHEDDFYNYLAMVTIEEKYDFISHFTEASAKTLYDDAVLREKNKLFTHPFLNTPAELSYPDLWIPSGTELHFTVDLTNTLNGVKYMVLINDDTVFEKIYTTASTEAVIIPLEKYTNQKVTIRFLVDPLGHYHSDWAYWTAPKLVVVTDQELRRLVGD